MCSRAVPDEHCGVVQTQANGGDVGADGIGVSVTVPAAAPGQTVTPLVTAPTTSTPPVQAGSLPRTGLELTALLLVIVALLAVGIVLVHGGRRTARP